MKYSKIKISKIVFWLSIIVIFLLIAVFIKIYLKSKNKYKIGYDKLIANSGIIDYSSIYGGFFSDNFRYPKDKKELKEFYTEAMWNALIRSKIKDPFSKENNDVLFIPVFSKSNNLCEGYLVISTGIDGKIDNIINDTIYFEDVKKLKFYNALTMATIFTYRKYKFRFNLMDYLFGNKDLLLEFANGIETFINNASQRVFTPTTLMEELYPKGFTKLDCSVEGKAKRLDDETIEIFDSQTSVICNMYKGRNTNFKELDSLKIAGQFRNKIDPQKKIVYLNNCIILSKQLPDSASSK